jgi:hypothetical protein
MRSRPRTVLMAAAAALALGAGLARAQLVITDPAVTLRDAAIAVLKHQLLDTLTQEADRVRQLATRLSAVTNLGKYALTEQDIPMWRIHLFQGEQFLYANPYHAALNYGDGRGVGYAQVTRSRTAPGGELTGLAELAPAANAAIVAQLATLDAADSSLIAGTDQTGQLRYNGRLELAAIDALEGDTLDPSATQSATAVLDKVSGAGLIHARQQQARTQFLAAIVEQLLVDNKRARDTETATVNMQLARLRWGRAANASLVAGSADDLRAWRQP